MQKSEFSPKMISYVKVGTAVSGIIGLAICGKIIKTG